MFVRCGQVLWLLLGAVLLGPAAAQAGDSERLTVQDVEIGFGGMYRVGEWTSLRFTLVSPQNLTAHCTVTVPDADDNATVLPLPAAELQAGVAQRMETCFKTGRMVGDLEIAVRSADGQALPLWKHRAGSDRQDVFPEGLRLEVPVIVGLGNPSGFDSGLRLKTDGGDAVDSRYVNLDSPSRLPTDWRAYQSLTAFVLSIPPSAAGTPGLLSQIRPEQYAALETWVRMGGHLIIATASETGAYIASPLAKWVPIKLLGQSQARQLDRLEVFSGRSAPLSFLGTVSIAQIGPLDRRSVLVETLAGPILVRVPVAFGRVTFLGLDLDRPPLSTWSGLPGVCEKLVQEQRGLTKQEKNERTQLVRLGISDLASQMNAAQEDFKQVRRLSYWGVLLLILCYLAVIGPLDYFLVHRWLKRPELTWLTFPLLVLLGGGISVWGATRLNGRQLAVNVTDLVDVDGETGLVRGQSWITPYSPETRRYATSVSVIPFGTIGAAEPQSAAGNPTASSPEASPAAPTDLNLSWMGIPENTVGGLYRPVGFSVTGRSYDYGRAPDGIDNLPLEQWSTKPLFATWRQSSPDLVESRLESTGPGRLSGSLAHHLSVPLEEFLLVYDGRVYLPQGRLKNLAPYLDWQPVGPQGQQRDLRSYLTGATATRVEKSTMHTEIHFHVEPYNPLSHARTDLVRMLTFHSVSGGASYTGLKQGALRNLELTPLMALSRAFLVGRVAAPATRLTIDGQPYTAADQATYVRFVLPVKQVIEADVKFMPNPKDL